MNDKKRPYGEGRVIYRANSRMTTIEAAAYDALIEAGITRRDIVMAGVEAMTREVEKRKKEAQ